MQPFGQGPPFPQWPQGVANNTSQAITTSTTTTTTSSTQHTQGGSSQQMPMFPGMMPPMMQQQSQMQQQFLQQTPGLPQQTLQPPPVQSANMDQMMQQYTDMSIQGGSAPPPQHSPPVEEKPAKSTKDQKKDRGKGREKESKKPEKVKARPEEPKKGEKAKKETPKQAEKSSGFMNMFKDPDSASKKKGESSKSKKTVKTTSETVQQHHSLPPQIRQPIPQQMAPQQQQYQQQTTQQSQTVQHQMPPQGLAVNQYQAQIPDTQSSILNQYQAHADQSALLQQYQDHAHTSQQTQTTTTQTSQQSQMMGFQSSQHMHQAEDIQRWARSDPSQLIGSMSSFYGLAETVSSGSIACVYGVQGSSMNSWITEFRQRLETCTSSAAWNLETWPGFPGLLAGLHFYDPFDLPYPRVNEDACLRSCARTAAMQQDGRWGLRRHDEMVMNILEQDCEACPMRLEWHPVDIGYDCNGGQHFVPHTEIDMILAGKRPNGPYMWDRALEVWGTNVELIRANMMFR